jgi:uncharacterized protein YcbK (DUF882 family)
MKTLTFHVLPVVAGIAVVLIFVSSREAANAQATAPLPTTKTASTTRPTVSVKPVKPAKFSSSAAENARLRYALNWTFGGKAHSGWEIYSDLIAHTVNAPAGGDSPEFAEAVSQWQAKNAITADGVIDEATLGTFVKFWQSRRFGKSAFPGEDALVQLPASDFYDPSRAPELRKLERQTYTAYRQMIAAAARDLSREIKFTSTGELAPEEKYLKIVSAYRSPEYQAELRRKQPNAGRAALAVHSPHNSGHAIDIYVGGDPVSTKDANRALQVKTPAYRWLVKNAHKFGFYPYFYEPWHWEYVPQR